MLQAIGHVAIGDTQGQPFGYRRFADTGLADEYGVILCPARKDLDGAADFFVAADDRIQLSSARDFGQVARKFLQRVIPVLCPCGIGGAATPQSVDCGI